MGLVDVLSSHQPTLWRSPRFTQRTKESEETPFRIQLIRFHQTCERNQLKIILRGETACSSKVEIVIRWILDFATSSVKSFYYWIY